MTRRRKLAIKISDTVVRRSLPTYRDWAEATRRELEFIQGDWAALGWALGSWKVAARCRCAPPLTSWAEVPGAARTFVKTARVSTIVTWLSLLWMCGWFSGVVPHTNPNPSRPLGWGFIAAVLVYIACQAIAYRGWRLPLEGELPVVASWYRAALERQRDFQAGAWYWLRAALLVAGPVLGIYRTWLLKPSSDRAFLLDGNFVACGIMVASLLLVSPKSRLSGGRGYQRSIDKLDALTGDGR
jgi:hypothetical protein